MASLLVTWLFWGMCVWTLGEQGVHTLYVKEGGTLTAGCTPTSSVYTSKHWLKGNYTNCLPTEQYWLFTQHYDGTVRRQQGRVGMSMSNVTSELTIDKVSLEDNSDLTCLVISESGEFDYNSVYIGVYITPKIIFSGLGSGTFTEGDTVVIACTIERLYPMISTYDLRMTWNSTRQYSSQQSNVDGTYSYVVWTSRTLMMEDDGTKVVCLAQSEVDDVTEWRFINVNPK